MSVRASGLAHSVQVRLATYAKTLGVDPNLVLIHYGIERFLYRLSRSRHTDRFVLKGGLMMLVWLGEDIVPFVTPVIDAARRGKPFEKSWPAGGSWG